MPPSGRDPSDPQAWLRRARSNLARAKDGHGLPEVLYEDLCFDAQQAAEKAVKAVLVARSVPFPKTHVLVELLSLAANVGVVVPAEVREGARLTRYAVQTRYPGEAEDVTREDYARAVAIAEGVVRWAEGLIRSGRGGA